MKVLIASTLLTGHLNPLLSIGHMLIDAGHEVVFLPADVMRPRIERGGAALRAFPAGADLDLSDRDALFPEWKMMPPGPERRRFALEHALSFGIPLVTAGLTEDKADVDMRVAWSGVGLNLETNEPTPSALREAIRAVLDEPKYRSLASAMAEEFQTIDTRSEILRILSQVSGV
jgi:UDP:flavonoid glycosyltransferase YjiC (YdhE family)